MEIIWEPRAETDLAEYQEYLNQFNPKASIDALDRVFACLDSLVEQPLMGKPGKIYGSREFSIPNLPLTLIYRIQESSLIVLLVHHHRKKR